VSYETDLHVKDGAWKADAKLAAGVDDVDNTHPLNCTTDGTLEVQLTGTSVPIEVIVDNVVPVSQSGTWTVNLATEPTIDIGKVDQGTPGTQPWPVTVTNFPGEGNAVNAFAQVNAAPITETTIVSYTVPATKTFSLAHTISWGDYDGEFLIRVDGTLLGGGRTSAAERTLTLDFEGALVATTGQVVTVSIIHYAPGIRLFRANILGGLN